MKIALRMAVLGLVCIALMAVTRKYVVDYRVAVQTETYTVANSLATNSAALGVMGDSVDGGVSGVLLEHGGGLAVCVSAPAGQTVTSGNMRAYVYMPVLSSKPPTYRWMKYPSQDWVLTGGVRDQCSGDKSSLSGIGRFAYVEDDVAMSGGTTLDVTYSMRSGQPQ